MIGGKEGKKGVVVEARAAERWRRIGQDTSCDIEEKKGGLATQKHMACRQYFPLYVTLLQEAVFSGYGATVQS